MGAGRRSVCFAPADDLAALMLPASVQTKNTFVHFEKRDPKARRGTCAGRLIAAPEAASARCASRALTCQPSVVLRVPDLRRDSLLSVAESEASCASPTSPQCVCLETPTVLFVPFSPRGDLSPNFGPCNSPMNGCVSPMSPGHLSPSFTPCNPPMNGCVSPMSPGHLSPNFPPCTPCNSPMAGCVSPMSPGHLSPNFPPCTPCNSPMAGCISPMSPGHMAPSFAPCSVPMDGCVSPMMGPECTPAPVPEGGRFVLAQAPTQALDGKAAVAALAAALPLCGPDHEPLPFAQDELFPAVWQVLEPGKKKGKDVIPAKDHEVTMMLRHLPLAYTPDELLAEMAEYVPFIDFYYLPTNFETKKNLGYAFLNFTDKAAASRFTKFWLAAGLAESDDAPVVEARVQGFAENVNRFRNSSVMPMLSADLKPRIFERGVRKPFPAPDKAVPPVGPRFRPTDAERPRTASDSSRGSEEIKVPLRRPPCLSGNDWPEL